MRSPRRLTTAATGCQGQVLGGCASGGWGRRQARRCRHRWRQRHRHAHGGGPPERPWDTDERWQAMRRRLLTTLCAGALLATAPAALANDAPTFTASWQTPTATMLAEATTADKNLTTTDDTLLANWTGGSDVWGSLSSNQTSRRVEGKQPLLLTLFTRDAVRAKPNPTGPGMRQATVTFRIDFTARKVDQDNCVTDEVPVDSLTIHSKVSFGGQVDGVGQARSVIDIPIGRMLTDEPLIG